MNKKDESTSSQAQPLNWAVFVTPGIPIAQAQRPEGVHETYFQAMASTLIYGRRDAVLVDAFMTVKQATALADWVALKHKNLTTIYITHGHGDHWFGVGTILERFPNARVVATPNTVKVMQGNASPQGLAAWGAGFPGQIPEKLVMAEELEGNVIDLEGHELIVVELGHTDTDHTTCLHVPSIGLVVAGDAAVQRRPPLSCRVDCGDAAGVACRPRERSRHSTHAQSSHHINGPKTTTALRLSARRGRTSETSTGSQPRRRPRRELDKKMLELYPNRVNPGWALWSSAHAAKP